MGEEPIVGGPIVFHLSPELFILPKSKGYFTLDHVFDNSRDLTIGTC